MAMATGGGGGDGDGDRTADLLGLLGLVPAANVNSTPTNVNGNHDHGLGSLGVVSSDSDSGHAAVGPSGGHGGSPGSAGLITSNPMFGVGEEGGLRM